MKEREYFSYGDSGLCTNRCKEKWIKDIKRRINSVCKCDDYKSHSASTFLYPEVIDKFKIIKVEEQHYLDVPEIKEHIKKWKEKLNINCSDLEFMKLSVEEISELKRRF